MSYFERAPRSRADPLRISVVQRRQVQRYQQIVDQFDAVARANLGKLVHIQDLCRVAGIKQHTLLRAFRAIHDTTPHRYLHALRLKGAREALLASDVDEETVTRLALRFGFRELGRFAVDYRAAFGESPSETLRRTSPTGTFTSQCRDL
jgi:AraC family ethanolamine operon transcriptional activator